MEPLLPVDRENSKEYYKYEVKSKYNRSITPKFTTKQLQVMGALSLGEFAFYSAVSILDPFFPAEASIKNVSATVTGLVFSAYSTVMFLASPFVGILINRYGPKAVLICSIILTGTCNFLFGLSNQLDSNVFTMYCFAVRILEGLGAAAYTTATFTFVAQMFPEDMGVMQGATRVAAGLGQSVGPVLGAFLYDIGGYGLPFYFLGGLFVMVAPVNFLSLPSSKPVHDTTNNKKQEPLNDILSILNITPVLLTCVALVVQSSSWGFLAPTLEPHLRQFHLTTKQLGLCFLLISLTYAVSSPIFGYLSDGIPRERKWRVMSIGLLCCALSLALLSSPGILRLQKTNSLISPPSALFVNILAIGLFGMSIALALVPMFELLLHFAISNGYNDDTATYGLVGGVWTSMYSLGEIIGPSLGAILADNFGFPVCAAIVAGSCLLMAAIVFAYFSSRTSTPNQMQGNTQDASKKSLIIKQRINGE